MIVETDLYQPVKDLLEINDFYVDGEVNSCDVVGIKDEALVIVELKLNISLKLILQAINRQKLTDEVYIAVPSSKITRKTKDILLLLKRLGIGLISVSLMSSKPNAQVILEPKLFDIKKSQQRSKKKRIKLEEEIKGRIKNTNIGGTSKRKILTMYKEMSLYIVCCLELNGPLSPKELKKIGADEKKTNSILINNYHYWFRRIRKGVYEITNEGQKAIDIYSDITTIQKRKSYIKLDKNNII